MQKIMLSENKYLTEGEAYSLLKNDMRSLRSELSFA